MKAIRSALMAAAVAAASVLGTACGGGEEQPADAGVNPPVATVTSELELRNGMRKLWTAHTTWTRVYLIDAIAGLPDTPQATQRLLQNQVDIGNAFRPFYGDAAANQLTQLLHDHITGAAALVAAAKSGDAAATASARDAWYANADQIATFLANANPNWPLETMRAMMREHLDQTLAEATARLTHDWAGDIAAYDAIVAHILSMSDALTTGVVKQFPQRVSVSSSTDHDREGLQVAMRALWQDHVTWTRVFIIDAVADLPDTQAATQRLLQNQVAIGNAIRPYYGDAAADQLTSLLHDHITGAAALLTAAKSGDQARIAAARSAWYANADQIAAFLASANPAWSADTLRAMMHTHLDTTLAEATARLTHDWAGDVTAYDAVVDHILSMSDGLSAGISAQFPNGPPAH